jgi:hypothetical protein
MNNEAIQKLKEFQIKNHLSGYNLEQPEEQADTVSQSHSVSKPKRAINYPAHIKPLKERIMSALANGCRTPDSVATYCGESLKLVTLQLGRWVSRGLIGKHIQRPFECKYLGLQPSEVPKPRVCTLDACVKKHHPAGWWGGYRFTNR